MIENQFKEKYNKAINSVKENYISELENQLMLRDTIISKTNVLVEENNNIKTINQLKYEYSNKLPIILPSKNLVSNNNLLTIHSPLIPASNNLPSINISNINSILQDVKVLNNNISRLDDNKGAKKEKKQLRADNYIINTKDKDKNIEKDKHNQARNYSQGIRNIMMNKDNHIPSSMKNILIKKPTNRGNKLNKDSYSDKSMVSQNGSGDIDSETIDIEHSGDENAIKRLRHNNFKKERKSLLTGNNKLNKDESPILNSPLKKDINKLINKRDDSMSKMDGGLHMKKKDLNVFLNDRTRFRSNKRMPFK